MASIKDLKKRIVTVKNTQQTTKAMKMVSAAKLRRSQEAIQSNRPYSRQIQSLIRKVIALHESSGSQTPLTSQLLEPSKASASGQKPKALIVLVASDRGLCGGFNGNIIKAGTRWVKENQSRFETIKMAFVGRKANEYFKLRGIKAAQFWEFGRSATFAAAVESSNWAIKQFLDGEVDEVFFIYNEFKNAIAQTVVVEKFLPLLGGLSNPDVVGASGGAAVQAEGQAITDYLVKPGVAALLESLLKKHFSIQVYRILLESQASEHGARMSAMESATRNAGEMMKKLTLQFNKQRQASITKELLEIISGSESQKAH